MQNKETNLNLNLYSREYDQLKAVILNNYIKGTVPTRGIEKQTLYSIIAKSHSALSNRRTKVTQMERELELTPGELIQSVGELLYYIFVMSKSKENYYFAKDHYKYLITDMQKDKFFINGIDRNNPFIIHVHLIQLYKEINNINSIERSGNKPTVAQLINRDEYFKEKLKDCLAKTSKYETSIINLYLSTIATFALACSYITYDQNISDELKKKKTQSLKMYIKQCYGYALTLQRIESEKKNVALIGYFTHNNGLYSGLGLLKGTTEFLGVLDSMGVLTKKCDATSG